MGDLPDASTANGEERMPELLSELLEGRRLRQYLLRTGPIKLGDILGQSENRPRTLYTLLKLKREGDVKLEGWEVAVAQATNLAGEIAELDEQQAATVLTLEEAARPDGPLMKLLVSLSEHGFRRAAAGA